jgi:cystathionine beta-synthase
MPGDTLQAAYRKMRMYDVSQLPVMDNGKLVGIVNETDILLAITGNPQGFGIKVVQAMTKNLLTLSADKSIADLLPIFERGMVAIIMKKDEFLGIITPIDLLQYLRKRTGVA